MGHSDQTTHEWCLKCWSSRTIKRQTDQKELQTDRNEAYFIRKIKSATQEWPQLKR